MKLCSHFGTCGGCSQQAIPYQEQLHAKEKSIHEIFAPLSPQAHIHPILAASPWQYRNKMEFSFSQNRAGEQFLGLIIAKSRRHVLNLEECHLTSSWFIETLHNVRVWCKQSGLRADHPYKNIGSLRTLTLREGKRTGEKMAILTVSGVPEFALTQKQLESFVRAVGDMSIFLIIQQQQKGSPTQFFEMHLAGKDHITEKMQIEARTFTFKISPRAFFQPNPYQAEVLYARALEMLQPKECHVLDLYCGTGTLSMVYALHASRVTGIELSHESVLDARTNLAVNGLTNVEILQGDAGTLLEKWNQQPDCVSVDPPRSGLNDLALQQILKLKPRKILYVSCNPNTQADNIKILLQAGYTLKELQPVDQFPHTHHLENIALLSCL